MGWRKRAYFDQWPGNGPFNHLPPWQRPGRACGGRGYGRGWGADPRTCARFPWLQTYTYQPPTPITPQDEILALENYKKELGEEKASIEQEISDMETQLKELKFKLESEKKQPTGQ